MAQQHQHHNEILGLLGIVDDSVENEEDLSSRPYSVNAKIHHRLQTSLFTMVYLISKNTNTPFIWAYTVISISSLQIFSFVCAASLTADQIPALGWIMDCVNLVTLRTFLVGKADFQKFTFVIVLGIVCITLFMCLWIGKQVWSDGIVHTPAILPYLHFSMQLLTTVLYMPFLAVLIGGLECDTNIVSCDGGVERVIFTFFVVAVITIFITFQCIVLLVSADNNPESKNTLHASHGRVESIVSFISAVMSVFFALIPRANIYIAVSLILIGGASLSGLYFFYMPFYEVTFNRLATATYGMTLWGGICLLVSEMSGDVTRQLFVTCLLLGLPMVLVGGFLSVMVRELMLSMVVPTKGMSPYFVDLVLRCKRGSSGWSSILTEYRQVVDELYEDSPFLLLSVAALFSASGNSGLLIGQYISKANRCRIKAIDHRFFIYRAFKKQQEEKIGASGALSYITLKHHQINAETLVVECLQQIQYLFESLYSEDMSTDHMFTISRRIEKASSGAKEHLNMLVKMTKSSPRTLLLYSLYAREVLFDDKLSLTLFNCANTLYKEGDGRNKEADQVTIMISAHDLSMGVIIDCSDNIEQVFGFVRKDLIGKNVDYLCPPPINNGVHERFLRHYIETAVNFVPVVRTIWVQHVDGYYMTTNLSITPIQDEESGNLMFQGKLSVLDRDEEDFIAILPNGQILFFSKGVKVKFNLAQVFVASQGPHVHDILPGLMKTFDLADVLAKGEQMNSYSEVQDMYLSDGRAIRITATPKHYKQIAMKFVVLKLVYIDDGEHSNHSSRESVDAFEEEEKVRMSNPSLSNKSFDREMSFRIVPSGQMDSSDTQKTGFSLTQFLTTLRQMVRNRIDSERTRFNRFKAFCVLLGFVFIILAFVCLGINSNEFSEISASMDAFYLTGKQAINVAELGTMMMEINYTGTNAVWFNLSIAKMVDHTAQMESIHDTLLHCEATVTSLLISDFFYDSSQWLEYHSDHATAITSLNSIMMRYIAYLRTFARLHEPSCNASCQYVVNNAQWDLMDATMAIMNAYLDEMNSNIKSKFYVNLSFVLIAATLVLSVLAFFIVPGLLEVIRVKKEMSESLSNIPQLALKMICSLNAQRTSKVNSEIIRINKSTNPFEVDPKAEQFDMKKYLAQPLFTRNSKRPNGASLQRIEAMPHQSTWCFCCKRRRRTAAISPSMSESNVREFLKFFVFSTLKLSLPLLLIILYFGIVLLITNNYEAQANIRLPSLQADMMQLIDFKRVDLASLSPTANFPEWSRWYSDPTVYNRTGRIQNLLVNIQRARNIIIYGNEEGVGVPLIDKTNTPALYSLYFEDACSEFESCSSIINTTHSDEILENMVHGLDIAINIAIERTERILQGSDERLFSFFSMEPFAEAVQYGIDLFGAELNALIDNAQSTVILVSIAACIGFVFIFIFIVQVFKGINEELVNSQALFLLLPLEVLELIPALQAISMS